MDGKRKCLVFAGDSITDCSHLLDERPEGLGFGYVEMIHEYLAGTAQVCNSGHDGFTAFQMGLRWQEDCIKKAPDLVTILVGINDLCSYLTGAGGYGAEQFGSYLEKLVIGVKEETEAGVILMEPFVFPEPAEYITWKEPLSEFCREVKRISARYKTGFVPLSEIFSKAREKWTVKTLTTDGIHLARRGHGIVAAAWLREYEKNGGDFHV